MRALAGSAAIAAMLLASAHVLAQTPAPFGRVTKPKFQKLVSPVGSFELEFPNSRDWTILPGPAGAVLVIAESRRGDALVVIERLRLRAALAPDEMATAADREAGAVKTREPEATDLRQQVLEIEKRHAIVVQYGRTGIKGREQVVHYAIPIGEVLYRVICIALDKEAPKYAPIFGHIAASIQPSAVPAK